MLPASDGGPSPRAGRPGRGPIPTSSPWASQGSFALGDGTTLLHDNTLKLTDGTLHRADGSAVMPDGTEQMVDGSLRYPDGTMRLSNGNVILPDFSIQFPNGQVRLPNGGARTADGQVDPPGPHPRYRDPAAPPAVEWEKLPDGSSKLGNGMIQYPDGNVKLPEGARSRPPRAMHVRWEVLWSRRMNPFPAPLPPRCPELGVCIWMPLDNGTGNSPSPGRPTPGVVKQDKSSGGSVDTTKTRSGPQRVRMSSGERPMGAAKGKQTTALCQPPLHTPDTGQRNRDSPGAPLAQPPEEKEGALRTGVGR